MAGLRALFKRKQHDVVPQVIQQPVAQNQRMNRLNTASTGGSTNSKSFFNRIFSRSSTASSTNTETTAGSASSSDTNSVRSTTRIERENTETPRLETTLQPQLTTANTEAPEIQQPLQQLQQEEQIQQLEDIAPENAEPYNFPIVVLAEDRCEFIDSLLPELNSHPRFDINGIVDSLVESLNYDESDEVSWYQMLTRLGDERVDNLHDFKAIILETGLPLDTITTKKEESLNKYLQQGPVTTKLGCTRTLENMKSEHYLCLFHVDYIWSSVLETGFMKNMHHKEVLFNLLNVAGNYKGFPGFVDKVLLSHDWDQHFLPAIVPQQVKVEPQVKLHPEFAQNGVLSDILAGDYECLICVEELKCEDDFWNCYVCHRVFHLKCISQWSKQGCTRTQIGDWFCPSCRHCHHDQQFPARCWCRRKVKEHNSEAPGSCGQLCGKRTHGVKRGRACKMTCHPGPHHQKLPSKIKPLHQLNQINPDPARKI